MSPRKVNKEEKRREIALSCAELIHDIGIKNITVAEVAKNAGIGKGTVYEYFENKEDIIFEIINIHIERYNKELDELINKVDTAKEKLEIFFRFILVENEVNLRHFNGYKDFLSIVLSENNTKMKEFNKRKNAIFSKVLFTILKNNAKNDVSDEEINNIIQVILTYKHGLAIRKMTQLDFDAKYDFDEFMKVLFTFLGVDE